MSRLSGRVAIVTGAGRGIGRAYARRLAAEGARVVIAEIQFTNAQRVAEEIAAAGGQALALHTNVADWESVRQMAEQTVARFGRIDILVNNAAIMDVKPWDQWTSEEWDAIFSVNVKGLYYCIKAVVPYMRQQGKGKIINIASAVFFHGQPYCLPYAVSKAAVIGLTRSLARELGEYNICVNAVAPGLTETERIRELFPEGADFLVPFQCFKRQEQPEDLVGTVAFLASDDSDFLTGQTICVDGGWMMH
ncbi:Pyridoxal 4-dehydrogenase [bacterium HR08]|nr:Pyridoxal 4-dehydrogenase [bacterium HR08]